MLCCYFIDQIVRFSHKADNMWNIYLQNTQPPGEQAAVQMMAPTQL